MRIFVSRGFRSLATLTLCVNVGELYTQTNSCGIARFLCDNMLSCIYFVFLVLATVIVLLLLLVD